VLGMALATVVAPLPMAVQAQSEESMSVDPVVVSATRTETSASETARSVTVIDSEQLEQQTKVSRNLGDVLAKTVPGMGPSTEGLTNFGQTLRGRKFLVLIDGIPQSNPLRDASRELNTISASAIERIEVIRGGTAAYGFGAKGGLINVITKKAGDESVEGYSQAGVRASTEEFDDSIDYETEHRVSGHQENWDYVLSGSFVERGGRFDSDGDRIPPGGLGAQGGVADTAEYNVLAKTGLDFDNGRQRLEFMLNEFNNEQDSDYSFGTQLEDGKTPAVKLENAAPSAMPVRDPGQENTTGRMSYQHKDLGGHTVNADVYFGDQSQMFPKFPQSPQGEIVSEKLGARTTVNSPVSFITEGANLTWGVDLLRDETKANRFDNSGQIRSDVPDMEQDAAAGFGELEVPLGDSALLRGGLRYEDISVDTEALEQNLNGHSVEAGTLDYSEVLANLGAVYFVTDTTEVFASYSEGFSIADIGRVLRDSGPVEQLADGSDNPDYSVQNFEAESFESDAEKVDNYEIGTRYSGQRLGATAAVFYSESDGGTTFDDNLNIQKNQEDIWGVEATADYRVTERTTLGGDLTWTEGIRDDGQGGRIRLDGTRIAPLKVNAFVEDQTMDWWDNRLQISHVGSRDEFANASGPDDNLGFGQGEVERYTLVDYVARFDAGPGELTLSVKNLLNEDYFPAISQSYNIPTARDKGQGRTIGAGYSVNW
ncbi:MAG: TonB-dependent receptor, partial [Pseudomonadota bacterium]